MIESVLFVRGFVGHLFADWLLQNDRMAANKSDLHNSAAWMHSGIHTLVALLVFRWPLALALGALHMMVDTRKPLAWWRKAYRQTTIDMNEHAGWHVAIWGDQVVHIILVWLAAWWQAKKIT